MHGLVPEGRHAVRDLLVRVAARRPLPAVCEVDQPLAVLGTGVRAGAVVVRERYEIGRADVCPPLPQYRRPLVARPADDLDGAADDVARGPAEQRVDPAPPGVPADTRQLPV